MANPNGDMEVVDPLDINYLVTPEGIVQVPHTVLARDKGYPISISAQWWREVKKSHVRMSASLFTAGKMLEAKSIVCLTQTNPRDPHGANLRCIWCVRFSVEGGSDKFEHPFGENFLWQIGYPTCVKIMQDIKALDGLRGTPPDEQTRLRGELAATFHNFKLEEWPECWLVDSIPCYYDRSFAMSVKPSKHPYPKKDENFVPELRDFSRPAALQPLGVRSTFDFATAPDDIVNMLVGSTAAHLAASPYGSDQSAFLNMRLVCRGFKKHVDQAATNFLSGVLEKIKAGHQTERVDNLIAARECALNSGLVLLNVMCDHVDVGILNWMRLRSGKSPRELPPDALIARIKALKKRRREEEGRLPARARRARSDDAPPLVCVLD